MPNNGAAVALSLVPPPAICAPVGKIDATPPDLERKIGVMVADAVAAIAQGVVDWAETGAMSTATRTLNGEMLGRIVMLRLDNLGELQDFDEVALDEGRKVLARRHGAILHQALITELLGHVVALSARVCADELAYQKHHAH